MENNIKAIRLILSVLLLIVIIYLLQIFAFLLIPITFALFITLFSYPSLKWMEKRKIPFIIVKIAPKICLSLEETMEYIQENEYIEVTPQNIRMRKI